MADHLRSNATHLSAGVLLPGQVLVGHIIIEGRKPALLDSLFQVQPPHIIFQTIVAVQAQAIL